MLARMLGAMSCLILGIALVEADEFRGTVKKVDADKSTITVTIDDKDQTFDVPKDAKVYTVTKKKKGKAATETTIELSAIKENAKVTVTTEKKDGKDVVTAVRLEAEKKKKKKAAQ